MYCSSNNFRCRDQGYCDCRDDRTAEAAAGCGGILFLTVIGIFAAFLYPAIRIFRSTAATNSKPDRSPKFAGAVWLFTAPVFGLLANMLYHLVFALGACTAGALESEVTKFVYLSGMLSIYALAMGLAVIAFVIKNQAAIRVFVAEPSNRSFDKTIQLIGLLIMAVLTVGAAAGVVFNIAGGYQSMHSEIENTRKKQEQLIITERNRFVFYIGTYKFTTRSETESFIVSKDSDGKNLRLNIKGEESGETNTGETNTEGCLLTPDVEGNGVYYAVSNCVVDGQPSPLEKVYFDLKNNSTRMHFLYNVHSSGDTLIKTR